MADVSVYSTNPGLAVLLSKGAQFNVIQRAIVAAKWATGEAVLGLVGAVVNDRGVPGAAIELAGGMADLGTLWGGFSPYLGDGHATGYEGNLYARARGIDAPRLVLVPVDLAIKTATIGTGTNLLVSFTRADAANGANPAADKAFLRAFFSLVSLTGLLGYAWALWEKEGRTWHDIIAQTRVIKL